MERVPLPPGTLVPGLTVRFTSYRLHEMDPRYYPPVGTVGEVKFRWRGDDRYFVQWPPGSTDGDGLWSAPLDALELFGGGG